MEYSEVIEVPQRPIKAAIMTMTMTMTTDYFIFKCFGEGAALFISV